MKLLLRDLNSILAPTPHKYLYLYCDHRIKGVRYVNDIYGDYFYKKTLYCRSNKLSQLHDVFVDFHS